MLGEYEKLLWDMATDMEPEHGRLWVCDTATTTPSPSYPLGWNTCARCSRNTD